MVDIHSHILFDIDDGAETLQDSVEMCIDAYKNGYKAVVATPHFNDYSNIDGFVRERNSKVRELRRVLQDGNIPLAVAVGAELYLCDEIYSAGDLDKLTINGSRYMLCEFPLGPFNIENAPLWIDELTARGYTPILAHPERYFEFYQNMYVIDDILDRGVLFQVNIDSLLGANGKDAQRMSIDMVKRKIARFIASDAHDRVHRHNRLREKIMEMPVGITNEMLIECISRGPRAVLKNADIL